MSERVFCSTCLVIIVLYSTCLDCFLFQFRFCWSYNEYIPPIPFQFVVTVANPILFHFFVLGINYIVWIFRSTLIDRYIYIYWLTYITTTTGQFQNCPITSLSCSTCCFTDGWSNLLLCPLSNVCFYLPDYVYPPILLH